MTKIKIVNYGTPGIGTSSSLSVDSIFPDPTQITVVNYKGGSESLQAVLKNEVQIIADSEVVVGSHIAAGTLYPLAVISPVRTKTFPNVPLLKDVSPKRFEEFGLYRWQGVFSNNHVSKEVLDIVKSLLADGQLRDRYSDMGFVVTPSIENNFLDTESKKINRVLKKSK
jgi:tripartite-type tricarboxylate transporter receptor subunit TctC